MVYFISLPASFGFDLLECLSVEKSETVFFFFFLFLGDRKRKGWVKRRRRQSGTKSSLKTLPKEDDSDDACEKSLCISLSFAPRLPQQSS